MKDAGVIASNEQAARIAAHDWASTKLGPYEGWPLSLKMFLTFMVESNQPMYLTWGDDKLFFYNDAYIPILGSRHPSSMGRQFDHVWEDIWPALEPSVKTVLDGQAQSFRSVPFKLSRDQTAVTRYFDYDMTPIKNETGIVCGFFGIVTETTATILREKDLQEQAERQRRMFQQAPGFICTMQGPEHVFDFVNDAHVRLFGRDDLVGKPLREGFADLEDQHIFELLDRVYATGEQHSSKGVMLTLRSSPHAPASRHWIDFHLAPITDATGRITGIFCQGYDVTDGFLGQQKLLEKEEQLRLATEAAEIGWWDFDPVAGLLHWPPRVKAMFGMAPDADVTIERDFYARLHPDDLPAVLASFESAADRQRRTLYDMEYRAIGQDDGATRWIAAKGRALFDESGTCVRVVGTAIDITLRKKAEQDLRESQLQLELMVEALKEADVRKDQFLATLAHELRNPLAPIRNGVKMLALANRQPIDLTRLQPMMDRQVSHMVRLIDDLMDASRISRGTIELRPENVDVTQCVRLAVEAVRPVIDQLGHQLQIALPSSPLLIHGDAVRLVQILVNLLTNAARFTPASGLIELHAALQAGDVCIWVKDTGIGIDDDQLPRLFQLFYQAGNRLNGPQHGLGIGLSLVFQLTKLHGGSVSAYSDGLGQGSTFTVRLPALERSN